MSNRLLRLTLAAEWEDGHIACRSGNTLTQCSDERSAHENDGRPRDASHRLWSRARSRPAAGDRTVRATRRVQVLEGPSPWESDQLAAVERWWCAATHLFPEPLAAQESTGAQQGLAGVSPRSPASDYAREIARARPSSVITDAIFSASSSARKGMAALLRDSTCALLTLVVSAARRSEAS